MKLKQAIIRNFRSVEEVVIDFVPSCRVLVGLNESGKTNIIKALALLDETRKSDASDIREQPLGKDKLTDSFVRFVFQLENQDLAQVHKLVSDAILCKSSNPTVGSVNGKGKTLKDFCALHGEAFYDVKIRPHKREVVCPMYLGDFQYHSSWRVPSAKAPRNAVVEGKGLPEPVKLSQYPLARAGDYSVTEEWLAPVEEDVLGALVRRSVEEIAKDKERRPNVQVWQYHDKNLLPDKVSIAKFRENPDSCPPLKNMFMLAGHEDKEIAASIKQNYENVPVNRFQNFLTDIAVKATQHFHHVWGEYKDIEFSLRVDSDNILPGITEQNTYDLGQRSDGFKRFVAFLLMVSANVKTENIRNTLLLVDEPETSLHPTGARALRDELIRISEKNYVVYGTHSVFMVDPDDVNRHYIVTKEEERTSAKAAKGGKNRDEIMDEEVLYKALGFTMFEVLQPQNLIFEGWRDKRLYEVALKQRTDLKEKLKSVSHCHATGVSTIGAVATFIDIAKRECVIVSDGDDAALKDQSKHREKNHAGAWYTYGDLAPKLQAITGEDFLRNEYIVKQIRVALPELDDSVIKELRLPEKTQKLENIKIWIDRHVVAETDADKQKKSVKRRLRLVKSALFGGALTHKNMDMPEYEKLLEQIVARLFPHKGK